jgi:hypothetical protein
MTCSVSDPWINGMLNNNNNNNNNNIKWSGFCISIFLKTEDCEGEVYNLFTGVKLIYIFPSILTV